MHHLQDEKKSKAQLLAELRKLRSQAKELKKMELRLRQRDNLLRLQRSLGIALSSASGLPEAIEQTLDAALSIDRRGCKRIRGAGREAATDTRNPAGTGMVNRHRLGRPTLGAFLNIVINADHAMPNGGTLRVACSNVQLGEASGLPLTPGDFVKITISDEGSRADIQMIRSWLNTKSMASGMLFRNPTK